MSSFVSTQSPCNQRGGEGSTEQRNIDGTSMEHRWNNDGTTAEQKLNANGQMGLGIEGEGQGRPGARQGPGGGAGPGPARAPGHSRTQAGPRAKHAFCINCIIAKLLQNQGTERSALPTPVQNAIRTATDHNWTMCDGV